MKIIKSLIIAGAFILTSCSTSAPFAVTKNEVGSKTGVASKSIVLNIWLGHTDLGISTAAKNGNIDKIATVDTKAESKFLGLVTKYSTIVTGE